VNRVYSYGSGGAAKPVDRPLMKYYTAEFVEDGYKFPDLLRTVVLSDAFRHVKEAKSGGKARARGLAEEIPLDDAEIVAAPSQSTGLEAVASNHK
jgi:hypothetical protein